MTPTQLRTTIAKLGFTQTGLGLFLGHPSGRTVRRWLAGERPVPVAISRLLYLMIKYGVKPSDCG